MAVAGARASVLLPSTLAACTSPRPRLLALQLRHRRPRGSLASAPAAGRGRLRVRMARTESTGFAVGFRVPQFEVCQPARVLDKVLAVRFEPDAGVLGCSAFVVGAQLPEPLTGKLWTLDDFEGNPALLISHSSCIACAKCF